MLIFFVIRYVIARCSAVLMVEEPLKQKCFECWLFLRRMLIGSRQNSYLTLSLSGYLKRETSSQYHVGHPISHIYADVTDALCERTATRTRILATSRGAVEPVVLNTS